MKIRQNMILGLAMASVLAVPPVAVAQGTPEASPALSPAVEARGEMRVVGMDTFANDLTVDGTLVGGLSGIDYDPESGAWIVISDDRSDNAPARFYNLDLAYSSTGIESMELTAQTTLLQGNGQPYPNAGAGGNVPDLESIRFDPATDAVWYTSEDSWKLGIAPFVAATSADGQLIATTALPPMFAMRAGQQEGPRDNLVFEGLSFAPDGQSLWLGMEGARYEDGAIPTFTETSLTRLTNVDRGGNVLGQFAYEIDTMPEEPAGFGTAGVTEVLAIGNGQLHATERATVEDAAGIFKNLIKVYEVDVAGATDVSEIDALAGAEITPVIKRLVVDLNAAGVDPVGNIEGISWGPELENGNRSLVLVSDNNFNDTQVSQLIVVEVGSQGIAQPGIRARREQGIAKREPSGTTGGFRFGNGYRRRCPVDRVSRYRSRMSAARPPPTSTTNPTGSAIPMNDAMSNPSE